MAQIRFALLVVVALSARAVPALAWNIPGHMLSAAIAYQVLRQENPQTIEKVKAVLEKHPPGTRINGRRDSKTFPPSIMDSWCSYKRLDGPMMFA